MSQIKVRKELLEMLHSWGAYRAAVIPVKTVEFEPEFRRLCQSNACGMYGRSWMCPPDIGAVEKLIDCAKCYQWMLVYQTVDNLEDSYDIEGMLLAGQRINDLTQRVRAELGECFGMDAVYLGSGGCRICQICAKQEESPCRFPGRALASLEAYGVNVSRLAELVGMKYINGPNTVTYFGAVLFHD